MMWLLTLLSLIGVVLNIYKKPVCFYIWALTNAIWAVIDWKADLYAQSVLFIIYFLLAVWGILKWSKNPG